MAEPGAQTARSPSRSRVAATMAGAALVAGAGLSLQVALTRLLSALWGYSLAPAALAIGLLGAGLGGVLASVSVGAGLPTLAPRRLLARAAASAGVAAIGADVALVVLLRAKPSPELGAKALADLAATFLCFLVPATFAGVALALLVREAGERAGRLVAADLAGAAGFGVATVPLLRWLGAPRLVLVAALAFALGGLLLAWACATSANEPSNEEVSPAPFTWVGAMGAGTLALLLGDLGSPWIRLPALRWTSLDRAELVEWSELGLLTVDRPAGGLAWMRLEGSSTMAILDGQTKPVPHPDQLALALPEAPSRAGRILVVGAGGGREVRAALDAGRAVVAVEVHPGVVRALKGKYAAFSGQLLTRPGLETHVADGRAFARGTSERFASIWLSLVDSASASASGSLALTESSLYTVEGVADLLARLDPGGVLVVNRWDRELDKLLVLAAEGLQRFGAARPESHLYACGAERSTALVVAREPLADADLHALRARCRSQRWTEQLAPDRPADARTRLVTDPDRSVSERPELAAPTDDRPFFFHTLTLAELPRLLASPSRLLKEQQGVAVLLFFAALALVLSVPLVAVPVALVRRKRRRLGALPFRARPLAFFACAGAAFAMVELALVQVVGLLLGHPTYGLTVGLGGLLATTALGAAWSDRHAARLARALLRHALASALLLLVAALGLVPAVEWALGLPPLLRVALALVVTLPLGLATGAQVPLAARALLRAEADTRLVALALGWSGLAAVVGMSVGALVLVHVGASATFAAAAMLYVAGALASTRPKPVADKPLAASDT